MHLWSQGGDDSFIAIRVKAAQYKYASIIIIINIIRSKQHLKSKI